jgi:hypothetical protein
VVRTAGWPSAAIAGAMVAGRVVSSTPEVMQPACAQT